MKYLLKNKISIFAILLTATFYLTGCYESHYYNRYHHHTRGWYDRHHMPPPPGVNFEIDVR